MAPKVRGVYRDIRSIWEMTLFGPILEHYKISIKLELYHLGQARWNLYFVCIFAYTWMIFSLIPLLQMSASLLLKFALSISKWSPSYEYQFEVFFFSSSPLVACHLEQKQLDHLILFLWLHSILRWTSELLWDKGNNNYLQISFDMFEDFILCLHCYLIKLCYKGILSRQNNLILNFSFFHLFDYFINQFVIIGNWHLFNLPEKAKECIFFS